MWNMQSGLKRKTFSIGPCPPEVLDRFGPSASKKGSERCVTGLASDSLNRVVIASTLDGTIDVRLSLLYLFREMFYSQVDPTVFRFSLHQVGVYISAAFHCGWNITASRQWVISSSM
jgi:hypothetical protein